MRVLVTGGCGYVGSVLVPKLLDRGYYVSVIDLQWFGNHLADHPNLEVIRADIREGLYRDVDAVIHLAAVADDPCSELDKALSWEIGVYGTTRIIDGALRRGCKHFIHASSGSVYGVREEERITEDLELWPASYYNKVKLCAEKVVLGYARNMVVQVVRPASICGWSPRMRLETSVNKATIQALTSGRITVYDGRQSRPLADIETVTDLYLFLLENPQHSGIFNSPTENLTLWEVAQAVMSRTKAVIEIKPAKDHLSYRMDDSKIRGIFNPARTVGDAIDGLVDKYRAGELRDGPDCYNLRVMSEQARVHR